MMPQLSLTPSYSGFIGSTNDAVLVMQAVLAGDLPAVDHRPHDRERPALIRSGHVFVFIEELSGIKRWTDGVSWLASRILGRFLVYRELDPSALTDKDEKRKRRKHLDAARRVPPDQDPDSYRYGCVRERPVAEDHGLIKKTLSVTTTATATAEKQTIHLILYYCAHDVLYGKLTRPSHGALANVAVSLHLWEAVKRLSLGGKIPIEDEAYYFLDSNYQLQNMSVAFASRLDPQLLSKGPFVLPPPQQQQQPQPQPQQQPQSQPQPITLRLDYVPLFAKPADKKDDDDYAQPSYTQQLPFQPYVYGYNYHTAEPQRLPELLVLQPYFDQPPLHLQQLQSYLTHPHQSHSLLSHLQLSHMFDHQQDLSMVVPVGQYPPVGYPLYSSTTYYGSGSGRLPLLMVSIPSQQSQPVTHTAPYPQLPQPMDYGRMGFYMHPGPGVAKRDELYFFHQDEPYCFN